METSRNKVQIRKHDADVLMFKRDAIVATPNAWFPENAPHNYALQP